MPLPAPNTPWPPQYLQPALERAHSDAAWLTGDLHRINSITQTGPEPARSPWQYNGGIGGATARAIYGKPQPQPGSATIARHLPVPAQLCRASANLLVGTAPRISLHPDDVNNDKAAAILRATAGTDTFAADLTRAATYCAALGWVYARIVWDTDVQPSPWIDWVDADQALPVFTGSTLAGVTFWDVHPDPAGNDKYTWRLLQEHTPGRITYGLYRGTATNLGDLRPVTDHPNTAYLANILDDHASVLTGTRHLTAALIPNIDGTPAWRTHPQLKHLGMSDISAAGDLWADIDKAYTDLMHEVDSARSRLLISEEYLETAGPGKGMIFNWGRDVFPLAMTGVADQRPTIEQVQFQMRVSEYAQAIDLTIRKACDAVGLSPITVGQDSENGGAMTATEIRARSTATLNTWQSKARMWRAGLSRITTALLHVDAALNGYAPPTQPTQVAMQDPIPDTELDKTTAVQKLRDARAASTEYIISRLHPEWTEEEQAVEVARIKAEEAGAIDPMLVAEPDEPLI